MQEPFGAYTWYPVNDQPADKALYDFTITAPEPFVGVANGTLLSREQGGGVTTTRYRTDEPMSSYLTTIAIGDYVSQEQTTDSGVPITLWVPRDKPGAMAKVRFAREAIEWAESKLAPTRSAPRASWSPTPRAAWRPRPWSRWATTATSSPSR